MQYQPTMIRAGAIAGLLCVGLGAFGAHGLEAILTENKRVDTWETAVFYHCFHSIAILALSWINNGRIAKWLIIFWGSGIVVFSGSLYALSLTNIRALGAVTPLGGILFLCGWLFLVINAGKLIVSNHLLQDEAADLH